MNYIKGINDWTVLAEELGQKYAQLCYSMNTKALRFVGGSLVDFMINIESVHDIMSKTYSPSSTTSPTGFQWTTTSIKQQQQQQNNFSSIHVNVDNDQRQLIVTYYCLTSSLSNLMAEVLVGIFKKFVKLMFQIDIKVTCKICDDKYIVTMKQDDDDSMIFYGRNEFYLKTISNDPNQFQMSVRTFCRAFPFHFMCDSRLRFVQIGSGELNFEQLLLFLIFLLSFFLYFFSVFPYFFSVFSCSFLSSSIFSFVFISKTKQTK